MAQAPQQNFDAMRQDAIRRSREMQRRAVPMPPPPPPPAVPPAPPKPPVSAVPKPDILHHLHLSDDLQHLLTSWDGEKLALLALLYLLYQEGAETELLLALAYIML